MHVAANMHVEIEHAVQASSGEVNTTRITVRRQSYGPLARITKSVAMGSEITYTNEFSVPADLDLVTRLVLLGLLAHRLEGSPDDAHNVTCSLVVDSKTYARSTGQLPQAWRPTLVALVRGGVARYPSCHEFLQCLFTSAE